MFRAAAAGPFDEAVAKATDENLTSEDWGAIIEVCDKVAGDANAPKEAVQSMIRRLAHRNANVQLYTLELAHALCQNCGKQVHREISSRAFTDALLKLANDRNTHTQVKTKILEKLQEWSSMFSKDPELGIMNDAYFRLKQSNPTLQAPSAPQKQGLTSVDRQKEEDELQMALKLSLQDEERKKASQAGPSSGSGSQEKQEISVPSGTTAATVSRVRALFDFVPSEAGELEFKRGDVIAVLESVYKDWWRGSLKGKTGIFPLNYVEKLTDPSPEELQREAQMEAEVFAEIKNVEKLLTLLSASNTAPREEDNEEISTLAIRPKLIKLIEKYSQKKDDFTQLNEKFIKARRDYESLLESSMAHPPQHSYHQYAIRPGIQGQGPQYPGQQQQQQDPQRFYTPAPAAAAQYQASSPPPPPPNFQPFPSPTPAQAPFYVAGMEVPAHAHASSQPYPPGDGGHVGPSSSKPAAPVTSSPPPTQAFAPYSSPSQAQGGGSSSINNNLYPAPLRPQQPPQPQQARPSYGAQELATSVYDSPIAPNPSSATYSGSSVYSQEEGGHAPTYTSYQPPAGSTDARQRLPSQTGGGSEAQFKPYAPGDTTGVPSAPGPSDYYRQSGVY